MIYSKFLRQFQHLLNNPQELEKPPEQVYFDEGNVYSMPPAPRMKRFPRLRRMVRLGRKPRRDGDMAG